MTERGKNRAANALMLSKCGTGEKCYFPEVYVVGDSPFFFMKAAKRYQRWLMECQEWDIEHGYVSEKDKSSYEIEKMTIRAAYSFVHKNPMPENMVRLINKSIDQTGK